MGTLHQVLTNHLTRYPAMQVQDVYKLLLQAALGSEHAARDEASARKWLERELAEMGDGPDEPLFDPISPDGEVVRVHLRPYIRVGKDAERLLHAFLSTPEVYPGSRDQLHAFGLETARLCVEGQLPFDSQAFESFFTAMEAENFQAVHHADTFIRLYRPAYRVVAGKFLEEL